MNFRSLIGWHCEVAALRHQSRCPSFLKLLMGTLYRSCFITLQAPNNRFAVSCRLSQRFNPLTGRIKRVFRLQLRCSFAMKRVCSTGVNKFWLPAIDAVLCSPGIVVPSLPVSVLAPIPGAAFPAEECSQSGISAPVARGLASLTSMSLQSYPGIC